MAASTSTLKRTRRNLPAAERREALIDCAHSLFFSKGYEATTIADIIARAEVSKGGFYHHFSAKEDLLEAVVARMTAAIIEQSRDVLANPGLDALERLNRFLQRTSDWKVENARRLASVSRALLAQENTLLFQRILAAVTQTIQPLLLSIVNEGVEEGVFDVADPNLAAEVLVSLSHARREVIHDAIVMAEAGDVASGVRRIETRMKAETATIERLLGVASGGLVLVPKGAVRKMLAALAAAR